MSRKPNQSGPRILHIGPDPSEVGAPRPLDFSPADLCDLPSGTVVTRGDVYGGLACLLRTADGPGLVVVCVDGLTRREMEFFRLVPEVRRDVRVYVYGSAHARGRLDEAIRLGAEGEASTEILRTVLADEPAGDGVAESDGLVLVEPVDEAPAAGGAEADEVTFDDTVVEEDEDESLWVDESSAMSELLSDDAGTVVEDEAAGWPETGAAADETDDADDPVGEIGGDDFVETDEEESGATGAIDDDEESGSGPARVPWLRYNDAPPRRPPERVPPGGTNTDDGREAESGRADAHDEPLLSDEELRALLGDDFAATSPDYYPLDPHGPEDEAR